MKQEIRSPELVAPAGSLEKLRLAYRMGADACYIGTSAFSMRTRQNRITRKEIEEAIKIARGFGKKIYVCINVFPHNALLDGVRKHIKFLSEAEPDGIVFADPCVLEIAGELGNSVPLHLSVQTSTANYLSVKFWAKAGVKRVILARELSLKEIIEIKKEVPEMELEAFIHGAVCMAYSGRCFLSSFFSNRDANQGMCAHNCRDAHQVVSATVKNVTYGEQEMEIEEDEHGSHLISSQDMCLLPHLEKLVKAGISAFKIEGRNKSEYYLAVVTRTYRKALDDIRNGKGYNPELYGEILKTSNRGFFSGFYFPELEEESEVMNSRPDNGGGAENYRAEITDADGSLLSVKVKGKIKPGQSLRLLTERFGEEKMLKVLKVFNQAGKESDAVSSGVAAKLEVEGPISPDWKGLLLQSAE